MSSPLPPPRKKQKTTPSCDQDGKDDPLLASSEPPAVLTTEIIARVASFVPYGTDAMNICLAVGPTDSAIIRHTCLRNNMKYLEYHLEQYVDEEVGAEQVRTCVLAWMAVNIDWRKLCTADNRKRYANVLIERENEDVTFQFSTLTLFNNPLVAVEFSLVDVLKHLVEEVGIDVNRHKWNSYGDSERMHLLTVAARQENLSSFEYLIKRNDIDVFSSIMRRGARRASASLDLFQFAFNRGDVKPSTFQAMVCHASFDPNKSRRQKGFGPLSGLRLRPLQYALVSIGDLEDLDLSNDHELDQMVEKVKILLSKTDVNPSRTTADCKSPINFAFGRRMNTVNEVEERWYRIMSAMKRSHPDLVGQRM